MTWQIFLGIVEAVGFLIAIGTVVAKMSSVTTALKVMVDELRGALKEFKDNSTNTHKELSEKLDEHTKELGDHEGRILVLEDWRRTGDKKHN